MNLLLSSKVGNDDLDEDENLLNDDNSDDLLGEGPSDSALLNMLDDPINDMDDQNPLFTPKQKELLSVTEVAKDAEMQFSTPNIRQDRYD